MDDVAGFIVMINPHEQGETVTILSDDGFALSAYVARPDGKPKAALVILQEIFGVNAHIRSIADRYAKEGYIGIAPAIYDRDTPHFEAGYTPDDMGRGFAIVKRLDRAKALADIQAAIDYVKDYGKVGIVGYCWGGTMAWLSAAELEGVSAAVGYYGGGILGLQNLKPTCPSMLHFGDLDKHIPVDGVREFAGQRPDVQTFIYAADHGFNCDARASFNAAAADLARRRTLDFFAKNLA